MPFQWSWTFVNVYPPSTRHSHVIINDLLSIMRNFVCRKWNLMKLIKQSWVNVSEHGKAIRWKLKIKLAKSKKLKVICNSRNLFSSEFFIASLANSVTHQTQLHSQSLVCIEILYTWTHVRTDGTINKTIMTNGGAWWVN